MTRLGITGHQSIPKEAREFVSQALAAEVQRYRRPDLWGITSLAVGADQMFAEVVLRERGKLHVVVPSAEYETTFDPKGLARYQELRAAATRIERLPFGEPTEEAFFAAGRRIVDSCEVLIAVWDGQPSRGLGGTADVVRYAQASGRAITVVWPAGVTR